MNVVRYPKRNVPDKELTSRCRCSKSLHVRCLPEAHVTLLIAFLVISHHHGNWDFTRIPWDGGLFSPQ